MFAWPGVGREPSLRRACYGSTSPGRRPAGIPAGYARTQQPARPNAGDEDIGAAFVVKDSSGKKLAYVYYEEEPGRRS
jgi:hypothetical protein